MSGTEADASEVLEAVACSALSSADRRAVFELFDGNYDQADADYLEMSLEKFSFIGLSRGDDGALDGFALGDARRADLPGMDGDTTVAMAGLSCVAPGARKKGLFVKMTFDAIEKTGLVKQGDTILFTGRLAHAITYRLMASRFPSTVPQAANPPSDWHRAVGSRVASLYGVEIDQDTFVVQGRGAPIGVPKISFDETPEESVLFGKVDRSRGDSLLAMAWIPTAPEGW